MINKKTIYSFIVLLFYSSLAFGAPSWSIDNNRYSLELLDDGLYLYQIVDDVEQLSKLTDTLALNKTSSGISEENKHTKELLEKMPLIGGYLYTKKGSSIFAPPSYNLIFAIVDAIVNRSLQREFSFDKDLYAKHLRIIFSLLVPSLNLDNAFGYDKKKKHLTNEKTEELDVKVFMDIKRYLDSDKKDLESKMDFLQTSKLNGLDTALLEKLEDYHSDDSDEDANTSEEDSLLSVPEHFWEEDLIRKKKQQIESDIKKINACIEKRGTLEEQLITIQEGKIKIGNELIETDFVIPGFRGINYMPLRFSTEARRLYRRDELQQARVKMPYFSEAALMSRFDFYRDPEGITTHFLSQDKENLTELQQNAEALREQLLKLRDQDYIFVTGLSSGESGKRVFSSTLDFLQHLYTNGIIKSQRFLRQHLEQSRLPLQIPSAFNPFVSESEVPEHAGRYSFGKKSLYQFAALHPNYDSSGKPSFPYIGEIYISLCGMDVIISKHESGLPPVFRTRSYEPYAANSNCIGAI